MTTILYDCQSFFCKTKYFILTETIFRRAKVSIFNIHSYTKIRRESLRELHVIDMNCYWLSNCLQKHCMIFVVVVIIQ